MTTSSPSADVGQDVRPYDRPRPLIEPEAAPYWQALREHRLTVQRCTACALHFFPPSDFCPACLEPEPIWVEVSGRGTVWGSVTMNRSYRPAYADEVPYNVSLVELEEGPKLWTNVVGCDPSDVVIGLAVRVRFDDVADDLTLARFVTAADPEPTSPGPAGRPGRLTPDH